MYLRILVAALITAGLSLGTVSYAAETSAATPTKAEKKAENKVAKAENKVTKKKEKAEKEKKHEEKEKMKEEKSKSNKATK